jgi:hypothetical protein
VGVRGWGATALRHYGATARGHSAPSLDSLTEPCYMSRPADVPYAQYAARPTPPQEVSLHPYTQLYAQPPLRVPPLLLLVRFALIAVVLIAIIVWVCVFVLNKRQPPFH